MDPASSALSLAKICIQVSLYIQNAQNVDTVLRAMRKEIDDLSAVLTQFGTTFSGTEIPPSAQPFWGSVEQALKDCNGALDTLSALVRTVEAKKGILRKVRQQVTLDWNRADRENVRQQVAACRQLMSLSLQMMHLHSDAQIGIIRSMLEKFIQAFRDEFQSSNQPASARHRHVMHQLLNCGQAGIAFVSVTSQSGSEGGITEDLPREGIANWLAEDKSAEPTVEIIPIDDEENADSRILINQQRSAREKMELAEYDSAEEILSQVLANLEDKHSYSSEWKEEIMEMYATACFKQCKWDKTQRLLDRLVDLRTSSGSRPDSKRQALDNLHTLAQVYFAQEDLVNAEKCCHEAVIKKRKILGRYHPSFYRSIDLIVRIYEAKGETAKAHGYKPDLPEDYYHQERRDVEQLINMTPEIAAASVGTELLTDLLPEKWDWRWEEIKTSIRNRKRGVSVLRQGYTPQSSVYTLLHALAEYGHSVSAFRLMLHEKPELDARDRHGNTPLHVAAKGRETYRETITQLLLEEGAKVGARGKDGITALMAATDPEITNVLLKNGAEIGDRDDYSRTALHHAASAGSPEVVKLLLEHKADINSLTTSDWTPLHCASSRGHEEVVRLLVENGADVNAKDRESQTPLALARKHHRVDTARFLASIPPPRRMWSK